MTEETNFERLAKESIHMRLLNEKNRLAEKQSSLNSAAFGNNDKAWQRIVTSLNATFTGATVGVTQLTTAMLPKQYQEYMQPVNMVVKGTAGIASLLFKAADNFRDMDRAHGLNAFIIKNNLAAQKAEAAYDKFNKS